MIDGQKISGMVIVSEAVWGCYPFVESIKSFLPVVDEMVVIYNPYGKEDGTLAALQQINDARLRIIRCPFNIEQYGWTSYGIVRTMGYQACTGNIILMFDCDGILHETEQELLKRELAHMIRDGDSTGYWEKHRIYKPDVYWSQHKHSGIYSKRLLGDRLDFLRDDKKGAPNFSRLTPREERSKKFSVTLFGYEHVWDTKEVLQYKTNRYGVMMDRQADRPIKTPEEYFDAYMKELIAELEIKGKIMSFDKHPALIQQKIHSLNENHFGYNLFNY